MNIKEIKEDLLKINPRARVNYARHNYLNDIIEYYDNSTYDFSLLVYCLVNDIDNLPLSYCGSEPKYEKSSIKKTCKHFSLKDKDSCPTCYEMYFKDKIELNKAGCEKKYGVSNPMQSELIKDKLKNTNLKKYGVEKVLSSPIIQEKIQKIRNKQKIQVRTDIINSKINGKYVLLNSVNNYDYLSTHKFYCLKCKNTFEFKLSNNYDAIRCTICEPLPVLKHETQICNFLDSLGIYYQRNVRILDNKEIDIFIPEYNIGIEHNGMYWHSDKFVNSNYHSDKKKLALSKGINLIFIYEDDWINKQDIIKNRLLNIFNKSERIFARKCVIKSISNKLSANFLNKYHIQGEINSKINIGLFYNNELCAVMTFGKPRFNKKYQYELYRYCSKGTIVGGASKLLKYFENNYHPESLLTYADMDWSSGNLYEKIGFSFVEYTKPNFFYYDPKNKIRYSRMQCQKKKLIQKYHFLTTMTGKEMINKLNYYTIYNSGNMIFCKNYKTLS